MYSDIDLDANDTETEYQAGVTAPPFHVYCLSVTVPYFEDDYGVPGDEETGKTYYIPADMNYEQWKKIFVEDDDKSGLDVYD